MLHRVLHALLLAWILPVAAVMVIAVIELTAKDPVLHEAPEQGNPQLARERKKQ